MTWVCRQAVQKVPVFKICAAKNAALLVRGGAASKQKTVCARQRWPIKTPQRNVVQNDDIRRVVGLVSQFRQRAIGGIDGDECLVRNRSHWAFENKYRNETFKTIATFGESSTRGVPSRDHSRRCLSTRSSLSLHLHWTRMVTMLEFAEL